MKNEITWKSRKKMSKLLGTLRKKGKKGTYYYRVQVATGERREFSLKTSDPDEALQQAAAMDAVIDAPNKEVALAQINAMKGYSKKALNLPLSEIWAKYEINDDLYDNQSFSTHGNISVYFSIGSSPIFSGEIETGINYRLCMKILFNIEPTTDRDRRTITFPTTVNVYHSLNKVIYE